MTGVEVGVDSGALLGGAKVCQDGEKEEEEKERWTHVAVEKGGRARRQ